MRQAGFTLVELVMVIVIVGIISIYAAPQLGSLTSYAQHSAHIELLEAIRYTQERAMNHTSGGYYQIRINDVSPFYLVTNSAGDIPNPFTGATTFQEDDASVWDSVTVSSGTGAIRFNGRGAPLDGSSNELSGNHIIQFGSGESITVEAITGYAHIQ